MRESIGHRLVEFIPEPLEEGILYVSMKYETTAHLCACGCGGKVVAPLSPTGWQLTFDGRSVSLHPSIGNWILKCRSHYWIRGDRIIRAPAWTDEEIREGYAHARELKEAHYDPITTRRPVVEAVATSQAASTVEGGWLARLIRMLFGS